MAEAERLTLQNSVLSFAQLSQPPSRTHGISLGWFSLRFILDSETLQSWKRTCAVWAATSSRAAESFLNCTFLFSPALLNLSKPTECHCHSPGSAAALLLRCLALRLQRPGCGVGVDFFSFEDRRQSQENQRHPAGLRVCPCECFGAA
ncbi:hypothetical protein HK096_007170 [Nowakowskiella sp. JEL0078]|nr:hypothetical protein HK096_007170 [Nowakowskiella sp. JEL0078]